MEDTVNNKINTKYTMIVKVDNTQWKLDQIIRTNF